MTSINTNVAAMAAVRSLAGVSNAMTNTQTRIETGLRVNKANDDAAVFAISQGMRGDLKGLEAVRDGLAFGKATLTVARDASTRISNELNELKRTITQGQQQGLDKDTMNSRVSNILSNVRSFAETATFNGVNLLNDSASGDRNLRVLRDTSGNTIDVKNQEVISDVASGKRLLNLDNLNVDQGGIRLTTPATINPSDGDSVVVRLGDGANAREFVFEFNADKPNTGLAAQDAGIQKMRTNVKDGRTIVEVKIGDGANTTPQGEMAKLVDAMKANGIGARMNDDGSIDIFGGGVSSVAFSLETETSIDRRSAIAGLNLTSGTPAVFELELDGVKHTLNVASGDAPDLVTSLNTAFGSSGMAARIDATTNHLVISGSRSREMTLRNMTSPATPATVAFTENKSGATTAAADRMTGALQRSTINVNDQNGKPTTETIWSIGTYNASTGAVDTGVSAGVAATTAGFASVIGSKLERNAGGAVVDINPDGGVTQYGFRNASGSISTVDEAISKINTVVANLGARLAQVEGQQEFIKQMSDSIKEGLGALVDADLAEESARLTSLQTKQQLATQSLSIANQQSQSLLSLFRG